MENEVNVEKKENLLVACFEQGFSKLGRIPEEKSRPAVSFEFYPLTMIQMAELTDEMAKTKTTVAATLTNIALLKTHIVKWDLKKLNGSIISTDDVESLKNVDPKILMRIIDHVRGDETDCIIGPDSDKVVKN